nr:PREDICTED: uncharacterized protein LOC109042717 [Bemisia tabaci]
MPCFTGYKRILFDSVLSSILTPVLILFAAHGLISSVVIFSTISLCLYYTTCVVNRLNRTVPFFFIWFITSIIYILINFEFVVSPLLLTDSSENFLFLSLISLALYCLIYSKFLSSQICQSSPCTKSNCSALLPGENIDTESASRKWSSLTPDPCPFFGMLPFCKTTRCYFCKALTFSKQQYCQWLDCHISSKNFDFYIIGLSLLACGLFFYTYLIIISACHYHLLFSIAGIDIYFPDDCSDVYYDLSVAFCFASGIYSLLLTCITVYTLVKDFLFLIKSTPSTANRLTGLSNRLNLSDADLSQSLVDL